MHLIKAILHLSSCLCGYDISGLARAVCVAVGYGLPGSVKELRAQEEALAAVTTTLFAMLFNVMRNWWKHRVAAN